MTEKSHSGDPAEVEVGKMDCANCGKKNKVVIYADGSEVCFQKGCGYKKGRTFEAAPKVTTPPGLLRPGEGAFNTISSRGILSSTLRKYGTFMGGHKGQNCLIAPLFSDTGEMVAQLARTPDGTVHTLYTAEREDVRTTQLYGRQAYGDRSDRKVIITSDYLDALTVGQITKTRVPAVSVTTGPEAAAIGIKANYRWLDRFGEIVLFFQAGDAWDQAAQQCAALFDAGKVKIAKLDPEFPTCNAALVAGKAGDVDNAIWAATTWRPLGIVNAKDGIKDILEEGIQVPSWPYPWDMINEKSLGMRPGEVTYHVGGTGIAKTTLMFHYAEKLLMWDGKEFLKDQPCQPPCKVGWFGFEDNMRSVKLGLLSIHAGKRLQLNPVSNKEAERLYNELFGRGGLELYDAENAEYGVDAIFGYMKYMVRALDIKIGFIDPLTYLVAGLAPANRVGAEDNVAANLATLARTTGTHWHVGYHLKKADGTPFEEGGEVSIQDIKGSGALYQFSNNVNAYERDQQGTRPDLLRWRNLKHRLVGNTGVWGLLKYDAETGRYEPTEDEWPDKEDSKKSPKAHSGFPPVGPDGEY